MANFMYLPQSYGKKEEELHRVFRYRLEDARNYFLTVIKPRLDRSYKLYIAYAGDRQKEIQSWQANVFVPYPQAVVETLIPRILDARPEFGVIGRTEEDQPKSEKQQQLADYTWEIAEMDDTSEDLVRSALIYGTGFLQVSWKKDVREMKFLKTKDVASGEYRWEKEKRVFYDAPFSEWVDNYSLWYDWHNTDRTKKEYWIKRFVLTEEAIKRKYPMHDKKRLKMAIESGTGDLTDYAAIRQTTKTTHEKILKGQYSTSGSPMSKYADDSAIKMYEVFEYVCPFEDTFAVFVGSSNVPILKGGSMPIPFDFKESPFIEVAYLKIPGEYEGVGLPIILESPSIMLNLIKNQRLDAATLSIHKMWVVNPLANVDKDQLVTRPFGIIYSIDPNGVREIQFSDIKSSAYREEEMLKSDMRYSSGVDDFSMGVGGGADSATAVRHLRESTLERVRLFVNHLGSAYGIMLRYWMDMYRQFFTKSMSIRILGKNGEELYPLIEKDDLMGRFDYRARVLPSIAGQNDIKKKQDMDLFQLLVQLPFIDQRKLTSKVISDWGWSLDSVANPPDETPPAVDEEGNPIPQDGTEMGMDQMGGMQAPPGMEQLMGQQPMGGAAPTGPIRISPEVAERASGILGGNPNPFAQAGLPINLLAAGVLPPTVKGLSQPKTGGRKKGTPNKGTNPGGLNRGGRVNTNIPLSQNYTPESQLMNRTFNIQR